MGFRIEQGDVLDRLRAMPEGSVQCVVTSPPYWGLRDYGVDGQIGLEATPAEFLAKMVAVFREVRRVLRADGTCWVNMGDAYANSGRSGGKAFYEATGGMSHRGEMEGRVNAPGLKPKDLIGMPWRLAFALQEDGWWLRQDIIWSKPNPMPESVADRCTKAHEYIFLLTKSARYYYDAEAVKETANRGAAGSRFDVGKTAVHQLERACDAERIEDGTRNKRSVWEIATEAYAEAHFATFPTKLVEPCILAGTSDRGCCSSCGAAWERMTEKSVEFASGSGRSGRAPEGKHAGGTQEQSGEYDIRMGPVTRTQTTGWTTGCGCGAETVPCTVMDIFNGAGTTGLVAVRLGREYVGIELNPKYVEMATRRIIGDRPLFYAVAAD